MKRGAGEVKIEGRIVIDGKEAGEFKADVGKLEAAAIRALVRYYEAAENRTGAVYSVAVALGRSTRGIWYTLSKGKQ